MTAALTMPMDRLDVLQRIRRLARLLDSAVTVPGTRFRVGLDGLIGLIPGLGDAVTTAFAAYIVVEAGRLGLPRHVIWRMVFNVAIDFALGAVPLLGDVFDIIWKANSRNVRLIERALDIPDAQ